MFYNNFSVRVIGGLERANGYVAIQHGKVYSLRLRNGSARNCDARVEIDGVEVGVWRINSGDSIHLEHPANDESYFTAYLTDSAEGRQVGLTHANDKLGLISVTFMPETTRPYTTSSVVCVPTPDYERLESFTTSSSYEEPRSKGLSSRTTQSYQASVGTGLSGHSDQRYVTTYAIDRDPSAFVTINLRLVAENDEPHPLRPTSTPIPPKVVW